ncbi:MAG: TIGR04283 family arsenosugar biosynthesis glycosyltransferase [Gemmatimonadales bacterium]
MPTLDEAPRLPRLLRDLSALTVPHEIIVADGGSTDDTSVVAAAHGARVVQVAPGRGRQLAAGVGAATGDWLLVVHADARLTPEALQAGEAALRRADVQAAAWPLVIDGEGRWLRWVERGAALRWSLTGLAYGDQGLLVRRSLYDAVGGYPDTRIMEDVVLIRRIVRVARVERLPAPILADARRWRREGQVRGTLRNVALLTLFLAGIAPDRLARWYLPEPGER